MRKICFILMLMAFALFASCTKETKIQFNKNSSVANLFDAKNDGQNALQGAWQNGVKNNAQDGVQNAMPSNATKNSIIIEENVQNNAQDSVQNAMQSNATKNSIIIEENLQNNANSTILVDDLESAINDEDFAKLISSTDGIDIDLTKMSADFVYATLFQFMIDRESYKDFTVRISGNYAILKDERTNKAYTYCLVTDASACCTQGIEFKCTRDALTNLKDGDAITVSGRFSLYDEEIDGDVETYYCLDNAIVTRNF